MNIPSTITDNITEVLVKIIEFTQTRQKILIQNINNIHCCDFVPQDMAVDEFSTLLNRAVDEHIQNHRLLLCDTENVKFGEAGNFEVKTLTDEHAKELLEENHDRYIELQVDKLLENSFNQRVAAELLKKKEGMISIFE